MTLRTDLLRRAMAGDHDPITWHLLDIAGGGHVGSVRVSCDALMVDGIRINVTHAEAQELADAHGWALLTPRIVDTMYVNADIQIEPQTGDPSSADSAMVAHSRRVDVAIGSRRGLVANAGKHWVLCGRYGERFAGGTGVYRAFNYGWHSRVPRGGIWQSLGGAHNLAHWDYSQIVQPMQAQMVADGQSMPVADVLTSPTLCGLLAPDGPYSHVRHPGVPMPESDSDPPTDPGHVPSMTPQSGVVIPWRDPSVSVGHRLARWLREQERLKVRETTGQNRSPVVDEWLSRCVRDFDRDGVIELPRERLPLVGAEWCAATIGVGEIEVRLDGEPEQCPCFPSGIEIEQWAKRPDTALMWASAEDVRSGRVLLELGDTAILKRGKLAWQRHVCGVTILPNHRGAYETVGGNEENRVKSTARHLSDPALLGFAIRPRIPNAKPTGPIVTRPALELASRLVRLSRRAMQGGGLKDHDFSSGGEE